MTKKIQLERLARKIRSCKKCRLWGSRTQAVPGEGCASAKILFLGESPGREEDKAGRPFIGPSGKFLNSLFAKIKLSREEVFITSVIKCHPPRNRSPKSDELAACKFWWQNQIEIIKPKIVVFLGHIAFKALLGRDDLFKCHGQNFFQDNIIYFPTFHPAAGRRFPNIRRNMVRDFKILKDLKNKLIK